MSTRRSKNFPNVSRPGITRCAIYTRKSTEEGLDQDFNSLDAQREACNAYIASQRSVGWEQVSEQYDDGGFTGGNTDRPALRRLMADIEQGRVDCVVVYKVDRLSRSLLDFTKLMEVFDRHRVAFVSVTQQFNTANSMGRLVLNVLLSFAQFEREIIAERTRDKMAAMRKKGKWIGGLPPLGYDIEPRTHRLMINPGEAAQVRAIFALYREHCALLPVVEAIRERGWTTKAVTTRQGRARGGRPFDRTNLYRLLTNKAYVGKVCYAGDEFEAEHRPLVEPELFEVVQQALKRQGQTGGGRMRSKALLKGVLRCRPCQSAMSPTHTSKGNKRYHYYTCSAASKNGHATCPSRTIPAHAIDQYVIDRVRLIGHDPNLQAEVIRQAQAATADRLVQIRAEQHQIERDLRTWRADPHSPDAGEQALRAEDRLQALATETRHLQAHALDEQQVALDLKQFDQVWEELTPHEQNNLVNLLIEQVDYDGKAGTVAITFFPSGIRSLSTYLSAQQRRS